MRKKFTWTWTEGPVDRGKEHFEIRYGKGQDFDSDRSNWKLAARVGPPQGLVFQVQILVSKEIPDIFKPLVKDLNFFFKYTNEPDPWQYAIHHCNTAANIYSPLHWSYYPSGIKPE
jgi:hypothetical protein